MLLLGNIYKIWSLTCTLSKDNYIGQHCSGVGTKGKLPFCKTCVTCWSLPMPAMFNFYYALSPSLPPYSTNAWRVRKGKSWVQSCLCTQDCLTAEACTFWGTILYPSLISSPLGARLWTIASQLYWGSFFRFCSTASFLIPQLQPEDTYLPSPNPAFKVQPLCLY